MDTIVDENYVSCFSLPATPTRRKEFERVIEEEILVTGIRGTQAILSLFKRWQQLETFFNAVLHVYRQLKFCEISKSLNDCDRCDRLHCPLK